MSFDNYYVASDPSHIRKERAKARDLKKTQWWRRKLGERLCNYCGGQFSADELTMDHRIPIGRGGKTSKGNVVVSCKGCNSQKSHLTPAEIKLQEIQKDL